MVVSKYLKSQSVDERNLRKLFSLYETKSRGHEDKNVDGILSKLRKDYSPYFDFEVVDALTASRSLLLNVEVSLSAYSLLKTKLVISSE